jgi:hypothetical protein
VLSAFRRGNTAATVVAATPAVAALEKKARRDVGAAAELVVTMDNS